MAPRSKWTREFRRSFIDSERSKIDSLTKRLTKCVVAVSGGASSAVALFRCLELFGQSRVLALFADTNWEDPDLYRFLDDLETTTGVTINRLNDGRNIWDVFDEFSYIRTVSGCQASKELKINPQLKWFNDRYSSGDAVIASGMTYEEPERAHKMNSRWEKDGFTAIHPLLLPPSLSSCHILSYVQEKGLKLPKLYTQGYPHNNCGGACVLAGIKQWAGLLRDNPAKFAESEKREREHHSRTGFTVLRDRRKGTFKPYLLSQLREDIEAGRKVTDDWRSGCGCMTYGEE